MRLSVVRALVIVLSAIVWLGAGAAPARAAEPIGPVCLGLETFIDSFELFLTPSGGQNFLLSGRNRNGGKPVFGSGRLNQGQFLFTSSPPRSTIRGSSSREPSTWQHSSAPRGASFSTGRSRVPPTSRSVCSPVPSGTTAYHRNLADGRNPGRSVLTTFGDNSTTVADTNRDS